MNVWKSTNEFKELFTRQAHILFGNANADLTKYQVYDILAWMIRDIISEDWLQTNERYKGKEVKQVYYFSIEFLLGRLLQSNLSNCGLEDICRKGLKELGWDLDDIIPEEPDAGLGNGGLGRLAACFIDSMASLALPGHGCSIRYEYGLFSQRIVYGQQVELPDNWLRHGFPWEIKKADKAVDVHFGGNAYMRPDNKGNLECVHEGFYTARAIPYDVAVIGYHNRTVNNLRLWKAELPREEFALTPINSVEPSANLNNPYRNLIPRISLALYPDDSNFEGQQLRLMQEYFFVSAGVQSIIRTYKKSYGPDAIRDFAKHVALHINDTHPALIIPELMRILMDEEKLGWREAVKITTAAVAYTNHTVLPEAMECWPVAMFKELLPRIYMIVEEIHNRWLHVARRLYPDDEAKVANVAIIWNDRINMAHLAALGSHSVNGVAKIHTQILKSTVLREFNELFPCKINNKTNGVTHRRWLINSNPQLTNLLDETIGQGWHTDPEELSIFKEFSDNHEVQDKLADVKRQRKIILADHIYQSYGIKLDVDSIFDVQVKRFHMYKRQLLNIFHVYHFYQELLANPSMDVYPRTFIFGGKAAASYGTAKMTIKLINEIAAKINTDQRINNKIKVVFIENYNVSIGQLLFPASDVSEQISTAGKEASGTGCMKFMMNGAITLGTLDGANVEIHDRVGDANSVIFGLTADEVAAYNTNGTYISWDRYRHDENIRRILDMLYQSGDYNMLYDSLLDRNDEFFVLKDFEPYVAAQEEIGKRYADRRGWLHSSIINIAMSGYFFIDRTIKEYAKDIWNIKPVP